MTKIRPMNRAENEDEFVIGYMCLTDFEYELGEVPGGSAVYYTVEDLRNRRKCVELCGIVEVKVSFSRIVAEPKDHDG